ncbi:hypothetical protein KRX51_03100 [Corynebacterium sp. TAE3-ERU12]|uniref:hypothetical protein n=1 Tax=Corynebacterium sp. TAE3-ERU12 TaxID=2849491 RepID=UPI001C45441A|nr:hypothetical protein [Corynebacterium sp. TAE3-ERU12]MBV7294905.1 hypothetical protein [Corynebacterium sp. TAE3-ERU12]
MDWWSIGLGIFGAATGVIGLTFAHFANCVAKKANGIAERAVKEAAKANRVAEEANELAKDANAVSERALKVSRENFEYQWGFRVEDDGIACVTNESAHDAIDLTLFVEAQRTGKAIFPTHTHYRDIKRAAFGAELSFKVESIYPELVTKARRQKRRISAMFGDSVHYNGREPIVFDVVCVMTWATPGGGKRGTTIKHRLSCREDKAGHIVFKVES